MTPNYNLEKKIRKRLSPSLVYVDKNAELRDARLPDMDLEHWASENPHQVVGVYDSGIDIHRFREDVDLTYQHLGLEHGNE